MTDTNRDLWSWAELSVSVVSGIAIPLLLGYFGWQYRLDQQEARNTDRIRNATELLASENWRERVMGVRFMWHYCAENEQYPDLPVTCSLTIRLRTPPSRPHGPSSTFTSKGRSKPRGLVAFCARWILWRSTPCSSTR